MAIGKNNISLRKKDTATQRNVAINFQKVIFGHKAAGGESTLNLLSLTDPAVSGFVQPSAGAIADANIFLNRKNLSIISTLRGVLMDYVSYTVNSSTSISFVDFTLEQNEILYFTVDPAPKSGVLAVNGDATPATGSLAVGNVLFATAPFEYNKYPTQQVGAIVVMRNGIEQMRCVGNVLSGEGNYIEVAPGSGSVSSQIQFKNAPVVADDAIIVRPNGLAVEQPSASASAAVESLAGQMDKVVQALADVSGLPASNFQANPNNTDLRNFGDTVISQGTRISRLEAATPAFLISSGTTTPVGHTATTKLSAFSAGPTEDNFAGWNASLTRYEVKKDGIYMMGGLIAYQAAAWSGAGSSNADFRLYKNGALYLTVDAYQTPTANSHWVYMKASMVPVRLRVGDFVELYTNNQSGSTANVSVNYFSLVWASEL